MSNALIVVGSVAFDDIRTPHGSIEQALGGSATYFALSSSLFVKTGVVSVVGGDFPEKHRKLLGSHGIDLSGLEVVRDGRTFRWSGEYSADMNSRETKSVELNVLGDFRPKLPASFQTTPYLFLANGDPITQRDTLRQVKGNPFVMADTMDLWIKTKKNELDALLREIDGLILNDAEAYLLTKETNLIRAGRAIRARGLRYVIIKKGEHGSLIFHDGGEVYLPASPLADVHDPTGAGDSFAGGVMGYLAKTGKRDLESMKVAVAWGTVVASFCCQGFGVDRLDKLQRKELDERFQLYLGMLAFQR